MTVECGNSYIIVPNVNKQYLYLTVSCFLQKDLDLIEVDDDSDVEALEVVDDDTEPIKKDDILKLIDELGIRKERPAFA